MSQFEQNWSKAYEAFDGKMEGCLGAACPNSCCGEKDAGVHSGKPEFNGIKYRTTLMPGELDHLTSFGPSFEKLGVELKEVTDNKGNTNRLVNNCLGKDGCKLEPHGKQPMICRTYPLGFKYMNGPFEQCPQAIAILIQNGHPLLEKINEADKAIGATRIELNRLRIAHRRK